MQLIQNGIVNLAYVHIHTVIHTFGASSLNTLALSTLPFALSRELHNCKMTEIISVKGEGCCGTTEYKARDVWFY